MSVGKPHHCIEAELKRQEAEKARQEAERASREAAERQATSEKTRQEDAFLKEVGLYGQTSKESWNRLYSARGQLESADVALFHAKKAVEDHNAEYDKVGFLKRSFNLSYINDYNRRQKEIEKKINECIIDATR